MEILGDRSGPELIYSTFNIALSSQSFTWISVSHALPFHCFTRILAPHYDLSSIKAWSTFQDVNDNSPVFESLRYTHTVSEVARVGTSILQVAARDSDSAANSLIHYSLAPASPDSADTRPFFINSETGAILLHRSVGLGSR